MTISKQLGALALGVSLYLPSGTAIGDMVQDVKLKSPLLGGFFVTAEVIGSLPNYCLTIEGIRVESNSEFLKQPSLNFHIVIQEEDDFCLQASMPFQKDIFVGELEDGEYRVNVYADQELSFSKDILVPDEVMSVSLDVINENLGKHSSNTIEQSKG